MTSAIFQHEGNVSLCRDKLNNLVSTGAVDAYVFFSMRELTLSGPDALLGLRSFRIFATVSSLISIFSSHSVTSGRSGKVCAVGVSILLALVKYSLNHVAFSWSDEDGVLSLIRGGLWCLVFALDM